MAGIQLTLSNMLMLLGSLAPVILGSFMILLSIFNQNFKGLVYIAGVILASVINVFLQNMMKTPISPNAALTCNLVEIPFMTNYSSPSGSALFIAFTLAYLYLPMTYNGNMNYPVIATLLSMIMLDSVAKVTNNCTTLGGSVIGSLTGFILGACWYAVFHSIGANDLLYFDEVESNNVVCNRPSKQTFKCQVYKNGQLLQGA